MSDDPLITDIAARDGEYHRLRYLIEEEGEPIDETTIMYYAVQSDEVAILDYLNDMEDYYFHLDTELTEEAAKFHSLNSLIWLIEHDVEMSDGVPEIAAASGCIEIFKYMHQEGYFFNYGVGIGAARKGNTDILRYMYENKIHIHTQCCFVAAQYGRFETLQYLRGCKCDFDEEDVCYIIVDRDDDEVLEWAITNGFPYDLDKLLSVAQECCLKYLKTLVK